MSGIKPGRFERECGLSNAYLSKLKHEPVINSVKFSPAIPN